MRNYFPTLNDALDAEGLVDAWSIGEHVQYGQTVAFARNGRWVSVFRDGVTGLYERPIHYATQMADTGLILLPTA